MPRESEGRLRLMLLCILTARVIHVAIHQGLGTFACNLFSLTVGDPICYSHRSRPQFVNEFINFNKNTQTKSVREKLQIFGLFRSRATEVFFERRWARVICTLFPGLFYLKKQMKINFKRLLGD